MTWTATTVKSTIDAPRPAFYAWLVPGVFFNELHTVLRDASRLPGVQNTTGTSGPWDVPGSHRTVHTTDGYSAREEVIASDTPDYFSYVVTGFTQPTIKRLVKQARGQWWFTDDGYGTDVRWRYAFEARSLLASPFVFLFVRTLWTRYMKAAMQAVKERADKELSSGPMRTSWDFDLSELHGPQGMTDEDRAYRGSRYSEVREALLANPYRGGRYGESPGPLPMFRSTITNAWRGALPCTGPDMLKRATARAIDSHADLRWGADRRGFRRMLSPNGICLLGTWEITRDTAYSGYFRKGAKGLVIGRYSSDGNETRRGQRRSLSLAIKLYPTTDPDHAHPLMPASFLAQEDLGGMHTDLINDAELRNEPYVTAVRRGIYVLIMIRAGMHFTKADKVADVRQLYEVAELGKAADEPTRTPRHILLKMSPGQRRIEGEKLDFRDEIYAHLFGRGETEPNGSIDFDISVSDDGTRKGIPGFRRVRVDDWRRIGRIRFSEAVASYNADHVVQFHHPGWRDIADDPSTAIRSSERRVRPETLGSRLASRWSLSH